MNGHTRLPRWISADIRHVRRGHHTPCWEWRGLRTPAGYGRLSLNWRDWPLDQRDRSYGSGTHYVHRLVYSWLVVPVPRELSLDHLCHNPPCCRPSHLMPVPMWVNRHRARHRTRREGCLRCTLIHCRTAKQVYHEIHEQPTSPLVRGRLTVHRLSRHLV